MNGTVSVRAARAQDRNAILAFCQNTFSWGDYISEAWNAWLANDQGKIFVGVVNDQPVGMLHVAFLNDGAAWMEGMRVHPDYRRLGLATAMDAAGRAYARERGGQLARLATARDNIAAQKTLARQGYACVAQYGEWKSKPTRGKMSRLATENDLAMISERWRDVPIAMVATPEWRWEKLDGAALRDLQRQNLLRVRDDGFAILREQTYDNALMLYALTGSDDAMCALARFARAEAKYRGFESTEAMIIDHPKINRALERAGFKRDGGMFIYEQAL